MSSRLILGLGLALAGCAAPVALDAPAGHPARPDAPTAALAIEAAALPPAAAPAVPLALRPAPGSSEAPMSHAAMHHGATEHLAHAAPAAAPLAETLDAYLALHDALASDRLAPAAARAFATAFDALAEMPPPGAPHFWHLRGETVAAIRQSAEALAVAADLDAARAAFGTLSAPFANAIDALGAPEGAALVRHTCGMTDAPEGGVWLQREGPVRNPYFGAAMQMCSRRTDSVPSMDPAAMDHGPDTHGGSR